jgi:hypothetical protein
MGKSEPSKDNEFDLDKDKVKRLNLIVEKYRKLLTAIGRL